MIHHYITKYNTNDKRYVESWLQFNIFGKAICFWKRQMPI